MDPGPWPIQWTSSLRTVKLKKRLQAIANRRNSPHRQNPRHLPQRYTLNRFARLYAYGPFKKTTTAQWKNPGEVFNFCPQHHDVKTNRYLPKMF